MAAEDKRGQDAAGRAPDEPNPAGRESAQAAKASSRNADMAMRTGVSLYDYDQRNANRVLERLFEHGKRRSLNLSRIMRFALYVVSQMSTEQMMEQYDRWLKDSPVDDDHG